MTSFNSARPVHVVIPARYGSTRLPGKPLVDLNGEPMIVRVHARVSRALPGADIVVAIAAGGLPVRTAPDGCSAVDGVSAGG